MLSNDKDFVLQGNLCVEAFNSELVRKVKKAHPSLQTLLNVFVNIEQAKIREYKYEQA